MRKKNKNGEILSQATVLRKHVKNIIKELTDLGYDEDTVSEIRSILHRKYGHSAFLEETNENETITLAEQHPDWKPEFQLGNGYDNLVDMKKWYDSKKSKYEIVQDINGIKTVLSWEEFITTIQNLKWTKFGMPKKYNKNEETIWNYLRSY